MSDNSEIEQKIRANSPINREYGLTVEVVVKNITVKDLDSRGNTVQYASRMIYLVPKVSSAASEFFDAWLPKLAYKEDGSVMHHELGVKFSYPVHRVLRCGICRKNSNYPEAHHLMLMSSESSEEILSHFNGKTLQVFVLPDSVAEASIG